MMPSFEKDSFPGRPKILFIAFAQGSHTRSWIDLLGDSGFNVRLFGLRVPGGLPPDGWSVKTYVSAYHEGALDPVNRRSLFAAKWNVRFHNLLGKVLRRVGLAPHLLRAFGEGRRPYRSAGKRRPSAVLALGENAPEELWLAQIIRDWKPDIIHTMGLDLAARRIRSNLEQAQPGIICWHCRCVA